jgi:hypothetical protein
LHTDENCVIIKGLVREDQRAKVCEIAEVTGIDKALFMKIGGMVVVVVVVNILDLNVHRMAASLKICYCYKSIVVGDETWVYEFTPESKRNSKT